MKCWVAFILLAAVVAAALRLPQLNERPMHNDEAVNAIKFGALWERGEYKYDPHEYHGPTLHYLTAAVCKVTGAPDFKQLSEAQLRLMTALAGIALVLLLPLVYDGMGRSATVAAACFTALSPMLVFYSRYWIHETLLVLFTFLAIGAGWRFVQKPSWVWAAVAGVALGLMQATKETFVFCIAAAVGAFVLNARWRKLAGPPLAASSLPWKKLALGVGLWLCVWATLFTSFFANGAGLWDSIRTYAPWFANAGGDSIHAQSWSFYFERLFWYHPAGGPFWTEGLLLVLAVVGAGSAFRRRHTDCANLSAELREPLTRPSATLSPSDGERDGVRGAREIAFGKVTGEGNADFIRFLTFFTVLLAAVYTVIPYKTPWCALGFLHGLVLLAGVGVAVLWRMAGGPRARAAIVIVLGLGVTHLGWQAWRASFPLSAERSNPWVYAHTSPDILNLVEKVKAVSQSGQGAATLIKVIATDDDYWPLPWCLREFDQIGWWKAAPESPAAPLVIASPGLVTSLEEQGTHVMAGYFQLRPQVFLNLYVERGLWEAYLKR